jgi:tRNA A-37 threonylcarbamoyl transferase component Bud32/tetratricopeptide (TPR) repeat protein
MVPVATLLERVRRALAPEYEVERELAEGGMGHVFLGREVALNRPVAIKLLRPELATAVHAERFLREARVLASVTHPNVVSIFAVGPAEGREGLFYFVMEYLPGTLDQLIGERPLAPEAVVRLGTALLGGLAKAHRSGVVHRDVKPGNIFLRDGVPVLGDFGIAKPVSGPDSGTLTEPGRDPGTPAYMAPEQLAHAAATPAADLYATAMVLYEALTGRRWTGVGDPETADWHDVPRWLARVLRRGLALEPAERWQTAEEFAEALEQAAASAGLRGRVVAGSRQPWLVLGMAAALAVAGYYIVRHIVWPPRLSPDAEIAVLPPVALPQDSALAAVVGYATCLNLERAFLKHTLRVTPCGVSEDWWVRRVRGDSLPSVAWSELHARQIAWSRMEHSGDSVRITLEVRYPDGHMSPGGVIRGSGTVEQAWDLGYNVAHAVVEVIAPSHAKDFVGWPIKGKSAIVLDTLMAGDRAFWNENWSAAERFYRRAVQLDSSLAQAWWGLYNVLRWSRVASPTDSVDLKAVLARYGGDLPSRDLLLMQADTAMGRPRVAGYLRVIEEFPYDAYPRLILGAELVHRGPLMGIDTDSAIAVLRGAAALDSSLSPIYSTLAMPLIRLGDSAAAELALTLYQRTASQITAGDFSVYSMLRQVWVERFAPDLARANRAQVLNSTEGAALAEKARFGLALGVPEAQLELGGLLANAPDPLTRASALVGQAVALVALGRPIAALRHLDSAAATADHPALGAELTLQAAEWRVLLPAVGVPGVSDTLRQEGRAALRRFAADPALGTRAAWAGAVDAFATGDTAAGAGWIAQMNGSDSLTTRLRDLAAALQVAARGDTVAALRRAAALTAFAPGFRLGDPFSRAVLYVARGRWLAATGDARAADRAWLWYLNMDAAGWPSGAPQAGEIDWALETHGRYLRAGLARAAHESGRVCTLLRDVVTRWRGAEPAYAALQRDVAEATAPCAH